MRTIPAPCCVASRFALVLLLLCGASGCRQYGKKTVQFTCGDQKVDVNTTNGAEPPAVYVCPGDTVTWNPNGHTFVVEFKNDKSPFDPPEKRFDNGHAKSPKTKPHAQLTVYEYKTTVDTTHVFDPEVIAGGGTP